LIAHQIQIEQRLGSSVHIGVQNPLLFGQAMMLATVDENGGPHMRWMATLSLNDFPILYTITSPASRKLQHIRSNPNVSWMFSNEEMNIVVTLRGKARIANDVGKMQYVWKLLTDKSKAYFLNIKNDGPGFAVIETEIEDIDATVPKYEIAFHAHAEDISLGNLGAN
jgi:general stress protein 26